MHNLRLLFLKRILLLAGLVAALTAAVPVVQAQQINCNYLVAGRSYVHVFNGFINTELYGLLPLSSVLGTGVFPNAGAGTVIFKRDGSVGGATTLKIGPMVLPDIPMLNAKYALHWNLAQKPPVCAGTMSSDVQVPGFSTVTEHWQVIAHSNGDRVELMHTDAGLIVGSSLLPAHMGACSNWTIAGKYSYDGRGWGPNVLSSTHTLDGFIPFVMSGAMRFRPDRVPDPALFPGDPPPSGSRVLEAWDGFSIDGQIGSRTAIGWYKLNANCAGMAAFKDSLGFPDFHLLLVVGSEARTVNMLNVDSEGLNAGMVIGAQLNRIY